MFEKRKCHLIHMRAVVVAARKHFKPNTRKRSYTLESDFIFFSSLRLRHQLVQLHGEWMDLHVKQVALQKWHETHMLDHFVHIYHHNLEQKRTETIIGFQ